MAFSLTSNDVLQPLRWWYSIGAPTNVPDDAPLVDRERVRLGKLTSLVLFIDLIETGIALTSSLQNPDPVVKFFQMGAILVLIVALWLNRQGRTRVAGILVIFILEQAIAGLFLSMPGGRLTSFYLPLFSLMLEPLLITVSLFPIWIVFPLMFYHISLIICILTFVPKTPELVGYIQTMPFIIYGIPITTQIFASFIAFIWVQSAREEMRRAETEKEVNRLTQKLAEQMSVSAMQSQILEHNLSEQQQQFALLNAQMYRLASEIYNIRTGKGPAAFQQLTTGTNLDLLTRELQLLLSNRSVSTSKGASWRETEKQDTRLLKGGQTSYRLPRARLSKL